jgi:hypothetical protein
MPFFALVRETLHQRRHALRRAYHHALRMYIQIVPSVIHPATSTGHLFAMLLFLVFVVKVLSIYSYLVGWWTWWGKGERAYVVERERAYPDGYRRGWMNGMEL